MIEGAIGLVSRQHAEQFVAPVGILAHDRESLVTIAAHQLGGSFNSHLRREHLRATGTHDVFDGDGGATMRLEQFDDALADGLCAAAMMDGSGGGAGRAAATDPA